jgi:hypothetical protein
MSLETMTKIFTTTVGVGGTSAITFNNIPQNYTDLVVKISGRTTEAANFTTMLLTFNGNASGYSHKFIQGNNSVVASSGGSSLSSMNLGYVNGNNSTASTFSNMEIYIPNYTSANNKSVSIDTVQEINSANNSVVWLNAALWANPSAINTITLTPAGGNLVQHSTVTLYGVKNAAQTAGNSIKATGGNIVFDGTYVTHTFNSSGSFLPTQPLLVDYLVVAGGGGGSTDGGAGGGGGGYLTSLGGSLLSISTAQTITVGAGGAGGTGTGSQRYGKKGSDSIFSTITSTGGGGGAQDGGTSSTWDGGSGGGAGNNFGGTGGLGNTPSTSPSQGNNGGNDVPSLPNYAAGGGGGAGAIGGSAASASIAGNGGSGSANTITGTSIYYAGGGGASTYNGGTAGTGGIGGGGAGGTAGGANNGIGGTVNLGGGGGGGASIFGSSASGGAGGSGVVIIRYKG